MARKEEVVHPEKKVSTGAYSAGIKAGGFLFVSGQGPIDVSTGKIVGETVEEQTLVTLKNVEAVLRAGGCTRDDVVKSVVHLLDIKDFDRFNKVYAEFFGTMPRPARTTVQSGLWSNIKVEIDVVALLPG